MQGVGTDQVDVGFVAAFVVDEVEVAALVARLFGEDDGLGGNVEFGFRKDPQKGAPAGVVEREDDVETVGDARLSVKDGGGGPGDHVGGADGFEA